MRTKTNTMLKCPLLNRQIPEGYCSEINCVLGGLISKDMLEDDIDIEEAYGICDNCEYGGYGID